MATTDDDQRRTGRRALLIGLLVACGAAAAAFARVYQGTGIAVRLVMLAGVSVLLAAVLERRHVALAALASAAGLLLMIGWLVFPETTRWALPTLSTLRSIGSALSDVGREANITVAPAPPVDPLLLAGVTAVWTAGFASHALAARARTPFLALVPQVALLAFAGIVVGDGGRPLYVLVFLLGSFGVLFADALHRIGQWGTVSVWHGRRTIGAASRSTARSAWRVAVGCLGVALFLPWLLPGFGSRALLDLQGGSAQSVSLNPIVDLRPRLIQNPAVTLFTVQANLPTYWQILSLDTFDGRQWSPSDPQADHGIPLTSGPLPDPGTTLGIVPSDVVTVQQRFDLQKLAEPWLPAGSTPVQIQLDGTARFDPNSSALVVPGLTSEGYRYEVTSHVVVPTPEELNTQSLDPTRTVYTSLPSNLPPEIAQIARRWTANAPTPYEKVMAIQTRLRGWTYNLHVAPPKSADDLLYFLTKGHQGYCQQFAGAMAVLLRTLGFPTRVAVGFLPGTYDAKQQSYRVTTKDFHAWVQVLFPTYGWLSFDPTPTLFQANTTIARYDNPIATGGIAGRCDGADCSAVGVTVGGNTDLLANARAHHVPDFGAPPRNLERGHGGRLAGEFHPGWDPRLLGLIAAAALLLLLAIAVPLARAARRRMRLRRGGAPRERVLAAYGVVLETAAEVGYGRRPSETIREYRRRLARSVRFRDGGFETLSALADRAAYAQDGLGAADGSSALRMGRTASRDLRRAVPLWRSVAGRYPIPGRSAQAA